ncbi:MAG TPA: multicopper oxidase family protein [Segeticoccus sp.]|uniref:multicopper oxidase family protein n=1 Tax=Segeticoccus sp. TaxID=2706531 RepID=UPI002D808DE0|nr:multicopper oxidase family protein [Segeticoccus sp.]HET8600580.1 multicopper oxidase family protein [Segeticoccus sp.]
MNPQPTSPASWTRLRRTVAGAAVALVPLGVGTAVAAVIPTTSAYAAHAGSAFQAAAAPAGKLTPRGCTQTNAGHVSCDLWAMTGTQQVLGKAIPIWGFSATGDTGSATAPGPLLVVRQGDVVTVTLHNGLAEPTSLAFPGQDAGSFSSGLPTTAEGGGVAPGDSAAYTFTASRPGTFLYEAGHTANGARQVAMGLSGALVVLDDDAAQAGYDDEAVLVLTEIDPRFNADPAHFDMRSFSPAYRLINGKPYPSTDAIPTDQGHKVRLRYVNAGMRLHSMSLLGGSQLLLSHDGHGLTHPQRAVIAAVEPGATIDAIAAMPTGSESKVAVFDASAQLDNDGQSTNDPLAVAFGGMLTFLDTNAPPPSTDAVGPVSSRISLSPNPSDARSAVTVSATVSDAKSGGSAVDQAEFVVDDAVTTGVGFGTQMTGSFGSPTVSVTGSIPASASALDCAQIPAPVDLNCLEAGKHIAYVRGRDAAGNWGVIGSAVLNLPKTGPQTVNGKVSPSTANGKTAVKITATGDDSAAGGNITAAEYFIGTAGAPGTGTPLTLNRQATIVTESASIPAATVAGLGEGTAHILVRSKDSLGLWGPTLDVPLPVDLTAPTVRAASVGPNPTNGQINDPSNRGYLVVSALIEDVDGQGGPQSTLVDAEAFLDPSSTTLAGGSGFQLLPVDGAMDSQSENVYGLIPLSQIRPLSQGEHRIVVRGKDAAGNWGSLSADSATARLVYDKTAPVLGTLSASPNPTAGADTVTLTAAVTENTPFVGPRFQTAEFWVGTTDPGAGKATRVTIADDGTKVSATVPLQGLPLGQQRFNMRVLDAAGNWSNAVNTTVQVDKGNRIFADTFDTGTLSAWSARAGSVSATLEAGIPPSAGNYGLAATLAGGRQNAAAYVTDNGPVDETSYHAQFAFDPHTLTSGTNTNTVLTIFEGRTANGQAFAVQYHTKGSTPEVRLFMARSQGGNATGSWVSLGAGSHVLRLDWKQGPATGSAAGQAVLSLDGTAQSTLTGANNTTSLRIQSVRLGITAGMTNTNGSTMAGTAWFDSFTSTRYTLP